MKWLLAFAAVHGVSFSDSQCRVLRQVQLAPVECSKHFASQRSLAASFSGRTPGAPTSAPGASVPGGPSGSLSGGPSGGLGGKPGSGSNPSGPSSPGSGASSPGGTPGNPGGGDRHPNEPIVQPPPQKPMIDPKALANLAKLRGELKDAARQRAIDRIIFGAKPPPSQPSRPGKPPQLGDGLGPGGLRDQAQPKNSGAGGNGNGGSRR